MTKIHTLSANKNHPVWVRLADIRRVKGVPSMFYAVGDADLPEPLEAVITGGPTFKRIEDKGIGTGGAIRIQHSDALDSFQVLGWHLSEGAEGYIEMMAGLSDGHPRTGDILIQQHPRFV